MGHMHMYMYPKVVSLLGNPYVRKRLGREVGKMAKYREFKTVDFA